MCQLWKGTCFRSHIFKVCVALLSYSSQVNTGENRKAFACCVHCTPSWKGSLMVTLPRPFGTRGSIIRKFLPAASLASDAVCRSQLCCALMKVKFTIIRSVELISSGGASLFGRSRRRHTNSLLCSGAALALAQCGIIIITESGSGRRIIISTA